MRTITIEVNGDADVRVDGLALAVAASNAESANFAHVLADVADDDPLRHDTPREVVIAAMYHEANRRYCQSIGDHSQVAWSQAPGWQQASAIDGVRAIMSGDITKPEQSHERWMAQKENDGWTYGPEKDAVKKTHHCMVPYSKLPPEQRKKVRLFFAIATALLAEE